MRVLLVVGLVMLQPWGVQANQPEIEESRHGDVNEDCGLCHSMDSWKPIQLQPDFDYVTGSSYYIDAGRKDSIASVNRSTSFTMALSSQI